MQKGYYVLGDCEVEADLRRCLKEAIEKVGGLDVLISNGPVYADIGDSTPTSTQLLEAQFRCHVSAFDTLMDEALPELKRNKGAEVAVSSVQAQVPTDIPASMGYHVAKTALDALVKCYAKALGPAGVRVNSVRPGWIETEVHENLAESVGKPLEEFKAATAKFHALNRNGLPEEIAATILFLCSSAAGFVTGTSILADGGACLQLNTQLPWASAVVFETI